MTSNPSSGNSSGLPWVIENVPGAPMRSDLILCGTMFGLGTEDLELRRHRLFEISGFTCLAPSPCEHRRKALTVAGHGGGAEGTVRRGGPKGTLARAGEAQQAMGITWMTFKEMGQAIPPAYTGYIGTILRDHLQEPSNPRRLCSSSDYRFQPSLFHEEQAALSRPAADGR